MPNSITPTLEAEQVNNGTRSRTALTTALEAQQVNKGGTKQKEVSGLCQSLLVQTDIDNSVPKRIRGQ
jgi:hypothetical protein